MLSFKNRVRKTRLALWAAAVACGILVSPLAVSALVPTIPPNGTLNFGGIIVWTNPCTTTTTLGLPGWYMVFIDKSPPFLPFSAVLVPGSRLNAWFAPLPGNHVLGAIFPVPGTCTEIGSKGTVIFVEPYLGFVTPFPFPGMGTSLIPFASLIAA